MADASVAAPEAGPDLFEASPRDVALDASMDVIADVTTEKAAASLPPLVCPTDGSFDITLDCSDVVPRLTWDLFTRIITFDVANLSPLDAVYTFSVPTTLIASEGSAVVNGTILTFDVSADSNGGPLPTFGDLIIHSIWITDTKCPAQVQWDGFSSTDQLTIDLTFGTISCVPN